MRRSGEKRNAVRGEKQKFPGNLPGTAILGPLHDGGEKFLVPVFGEDKKGLINDLLCAGVRAACASRNTAASSRSLRVRMFSGAAQSRARS